MREEEGQKIAYHISIKIELKKYIKNCIQKDKKIVCKKKKIVPG